MTTHYIISSTLEFLFAGFLVLGLLNERKLALLERKLINKVKKHIYNLIVKHEKRQKLKNYYAKKQLNEDNCAICPKI